MSVCDRSPVSFSIPFSRSMSRTASMISWLMSLPFVDQIAPDDCVVGDVHVVAVDADRDGAFAGVLDLSLEVFAASDLGSGFYRRLSPDDLEEVRAPPEWA